MNVYRYFRCGLVALSTFGLLLPQALHAQTAQTIAEQNSTIISDVALESGGVLRGQVVNAEGAAEAGLEVIIEARGQQIARTTTDEQGNFAVSKLRGGTYGVRVGEQVAACRVWAPNTAPPSASPGLLLVTGTATRGQLGIVRQYGPGALIVLGGLGAIIAISVSNNNDGS